MTDERWLDEREQRAWRSFFEMQAKLRRQLNRQLQAESGLSEADYDVLVSLSEAPGGRLRVFELRGAAKWEKSRLTHQITRMAGRGLLERQVVSSDPRGAFIALTDAGFQAIRDAAPRHVAQVRRWFLDALTPEQLDALAEIAESVLTGLEADPSEPV